VPIASYTQIPKGFASNLDFRRWLIGRADANKRVRQGLIETCKHDLLFFVNSFCWTYDPRLKIKSVPWITYPFQDDALVFGQSEDRWALGRCIDDRQDLVIYKSRDMGASWMSLLTMMHRWQFWPGNSFLMLSRNEELVDKPGDPDSLFWKIDFLLKHLPEWLLPAKFKRADRHFENLDNGSTMDGTATTSTAGVGGRRTAIFIDELSRIRDADKVIEGTADTTDCRIYNFTTYGTDHISYKLTKHPTLRKLKLHWKEHPVKSQGLYQYGKVSKRIEILDKTYSFPPDYKFHYDGRLRSIAYDREWDRRANPQEMARMWDIDFEGADYNFFSPELITELQASTLAPLWEGSLSIDENASRVRGLNSGEGPLKMWINMDARGLPPPAPYSIGADISFGTGATPSCLSVINCETGVKVAEFVSPDYDPKQFAIFAVALCRFFASLAGEPASLIWESQGPGTSFGKKVLELNHFNVYFRKSELSIAGKDKNEIPGWHPSTDNRSRALQDYREALISHACVNYSYEALEECRRFKHTAHGVFHTEVKTKDPTGAGANHADRVIADMLAWKMAMGKQKQMEKPPETQAAETYGTLAWRRAKRLARERAEECWS
jgi:hypothetical protein